MANDPWLELFYRILERAALDLFGRSLHLELNGIRKYNQNKILKTIKSAESWFKSPDFFLYCSALDINPDYILEKLNGK